MASVQDQYEVFPYPERDPKDERKRLIQGSPSNPLEMDHFLWGGVRDWTKPLKVLVAGGGTGDGLIQLAVMLKAANRPYDITYIDLSSASRAIAEERANIRGLTGITFLSGDLLQAPDLGKFDYIDCCGVLHHLPEPALGFRALREALTDDGGLGFMVYAPYGRSGVYPLQDAFGTVLAGVPPKDRLSKAREIFAKLPTDHPFRRNRNLVDHNQSDAGFYDLLLHSQDQAFDVERLCRTLDAADLDLVNFFQPTQYDLNRFTKIPDGMEHVAAMAAAERLDGTIKTHVGYAVKKGREVRVSGSDDRKSIPHLKGIPPQALAKAISRNGNVEMNLGTEKIRLDIPKSGAPLIAQINGHRTLDKIRAAAGLDPVAFASLWGPTARMLSGWGLLWYSGLNRA